MENVKLYQLNQVMKNMLEIRSLCTLSTYMLQKQQTILIYRQQGSKMKSMVKIDVSILETDHCLRYDSLRKGRVIKLKYI